MSAPPVFVLGVSRSGTTMLRVILDRSSRLAIPEESFFIPQLAERHGATVEPEAFLDDLRRLPALRTWGSPRLPSRLACGPPCRSERRSRRCTRRTPRWRESRAGATRLPRISSTCRCSSGSSPTAVYVHLIRDGRDAAVAFLDLPDGVATESWSLPRTAARFACLWRTDVLAARALGRRVGSGRYVEIRYEELVRDPRAAVEAICPGLGLEFEPAMLDYVGATEVVRHPQHQRLREAPTPGLRDWRRELAEADRAAFEAVAGDVLAELGYETGREPTGAERLRARRERASYAARAWAWRAAARGVRRSPLWKRRHPPLA